MLVSGVWWGERLVRKLLLMLLPMGPLLLPDDHHLLRYYVAIMRVVRPLFVKVLLLLTKNNSNMKQLIYRLPGYSNRQFKKDFGELERRHLDDNVSPDVYDISLIFKLLQLICGLAHRDDAKWSTRGTLEHNLRTMKNYRNEFAHEELSITRENLQDRISLIEELCREVLVATGRRCRILVTAEVRVMEEALEEILTGSIDLWEPYREALHNLQQQQCSTMVREGKKEIRDVAKKLRILNPFVWLLEDNFSHLDVGHIFTEVQIMGGELVETQDLFTTTLTPSGLLPSTLILQGPPGIGKTSLVRYLIHDWLSSFPSTNGLDNFDLLLPVEARHVSWSSVQQLLREQLLPETCRCLSSDDVIPILQEISTLWLIDGYDEATHKTKLLIKEILIKFPKSKFVITTRTECTKDVELLLSDVKVSNIVFSIHGFSEENRTKYVEKLFAVSVQNKANCKKFCKDFLQYLSDHENQMLEVAKVPLFVAMLVVLWLETPANITSATTATSLYQILITLIVNKMTRRLKLTATGLSDREVRENMDIFLNMIGRIFWENSRDNVSTLRDHQIKEVEGKCKELGLPFAECMPPFFLVIVKATTMGTTEEYQPLHRTVQEFLAARAFCTAMISQDSDVLTIAGQWKKKTTVEPFFSNIDVEEEMRNKNTFTMKKLCEDDGSLFRDFGFMSYYNIFEDKYSAVFEDPESEDCGRRHCQWYFHYLTSSSMVMPFMAGYLKLQNQLSCARAEQIVYVQVHGRESEPTYFLFLALVQESEADRNLIKELSLQISCFQWNISSIYEFADVQELIKHIPPTSILVYPEVPMSNPILYNKNMIKFSSEIAKLPLDIHLDFRNTLLPALDMSNVAKECLRELLGDSAQCCLTSLCCSLGQDLEILTLLKKASDLQELALVIPLDCLHCLTDLIMIVESLPLLQEFILILGPHIPATQMDHLQYVILGMFPGIPGYEEYKGIVPVPLKYTLTKESKSKTRRGVISSPRCTSHLLYFKMNYTITLSRKPRLGQVTQACIPSYLRSVDIFDLTKSTDSSFNGEDIPTTTINKPTRISLFVKLVNG
ncbi:uncharacterized protein LOC121862334 [Homarus americanus]|uniref:NACHT, LRR and PYD domains-containing protein 10-like 2 n=1 Tax=Homarus americanus TaxID=6706 RepID=A0A8J5NEA6_HOMAM|nr:uncharacterized protein LOC121862334 [Homarus americanus]KAG7177699.1 NACHT, LRR and PYD domains-containing protein 10-like 2 [Homarus americanus]